MNLNYLAQRIREIRRRRGLTLEQLADRSQLTQSVLSKVENSRVTPSLTALGKISDGLGVTLAELVEGVDEKPRLVIVRKEEREIIDRDRPRSAIVYRGLASSGHAGLMDALMLEIPSGEPRKEPLPHEGEEFVLVLKGTVELEYDDTRHRLRKGDTAYLDASEKHRFLNPGHATAEVLCVFCADNNVR